eukprot:TRINITY_DN8225_c0_g1_i1.p1 TRINITY_DN8225_c0_g1~~TRINITY_DN8225_c0_g1_i1.p1  ORF type:complete len:621 (+),score=154.98 TRINITY_DN8225_c0_g1_i1:222-1865(+)
MNHITNAGVSDVCFIDNDRLHLPKLDGIYFLSPSEENIKSIIEDFDDADNPRYRRVHFFFTSRLSDKLMKALSQARVMPRVKTFKEANFEYLVYDSHTFHFDYPRSFYNLYSKTQTSQNEERSSISDKLATVISTMGENPIIRYSRSNSNCAAIASMVHDRLEKLRKGGQLKGTSSTRSIMLILDRTHDLMAPLVHELTYQAMVEDIIQPPNDVYKYTFVDGENNEQEREVILNENDPIWRAVRNMHFQNAKSWITTNFKKFREENKTMGHDLTKQLKAMPKFQQIKSKFSVHINIAKQCSDYFNRNGLERICNAEQDLATGLDENNKKSSTPKDLNLILGDSTVSNENKLRLLMMHYLANSKEASSRDTWEGQAKLSNAEKTAISNFLALRDVTTRQNHQRAPAQSTEWEFVVSRYQPILLDVLMKLSRGELETKEYPFLNQDEEKDPANRPNTNSYSKKAKTTNKGRVFLFIAGGCTYNEIRTAHKISEEEKLDIVLGSTHILTPQSFLRQVGALSSNANDSAYDSQQMMDTLINLGGDGVEDSN